MKYRFVFVGLLLGICLSGRPAAAQDASMTGLGVSIQKATPSGIVRVKLVNRSKQSIRVFRDSNTWGAARWRILRIRGGAVEAFAQTLKEIYTRNVPAFDDLPAGASVDVQLDINDKGWLPDPSSTVNARLASGDTIVVVYDGPVTSEAEQLHVWHGISADIAKVP